MPRRVDEEPTLVRIAVSPTELSLAPHEEAQLKVTAFYSDDSTRDVTARTSFQSNEAAIVAVDVGGAVQAGPLQGETALMARYMYHIAVTNVAIPNPQPAPAEQFAKLPRRNFIDERVWEKLQSLGIAPSAPASDAKFLRRVYIDIIGRLPTAAEARAFLADENPQRREALVDALLQRPEYADHWANKWADLLRPNPYRVGIKATLNYDNWIREQFRRNRPYDEFVHDLVTARGSTWHNGAATLFRDRRSPDEVTTIIAQLFLGIRLECASATIIRSSGGGKTTSTASPRTSPASAARGAGCRRLSPATKKSFCSTDKGAVEHPLTGESMPPRPLFGEAPDVAKEDDPAMALADWMVADGGEYFAQVQVNRVWADLMGRGIVEPVDDLRSTNPPTNGPLLKALGDEFRQQRLRPEASDSHDHDLARLRAQFAAVAE